MTTLTEHRTRLDSLAHALLERETLAENDAYHAAGISRETAPGAQARGDDVPGIYTAPGMAPTPVKGAVR